MTYISELEIEQYMQYNKKFFENSEIARFKNIIGNSNITLHELNTVKYKSPALGTALSVILGLLGVDRFYSGNYILGILKLCTFGCSGFWWVIDWFLIGKAIKRNNQSKLYSFLNGEVNSTSFNFNANTVKNVLQSKEVRNAAKEVIKSAKNITDTFDIEN